MVGGCLGAVSNLFDGCDGHLARDSCLALARGPWHPVNNYRLFKVSDLDKLLSKTEPTGTLIVRNHFGQTGFGNWQDILLEVVDLSTRRQEFNASFGPIRFR